MIPELRPSSYAVINFKYSLIIIIVMGIKSSLCTSIYNGLTCNMFQFCLSSVLLAHQLLEGVVIGVVHKCTPKPNYYGGKLHKYANPQEEIHECRGVKIYKIFTSLTYLNDFMIHCYRSIIEMVRS